MFIYIYNNDNRYLLGRFFFWKNAVLMFGTYNLDEISQKLGSSPEVLKRGVV